MTKNKGLKKDYEKWVAETLLYALGLKMPHLRHGNDIDEPDEIFGTSSRPIGIEVATAYYDDSDARQQWMHARGEREMPDTGVELRDAGTLVGPDAGICSRIQSEISDKCGKQYSKIAETWLCVVENAPLSDESSITECISKLIIPTDCRLERIYILHHSPMHEGGRYKVFRVKASD